VEEVSPVVNEEWGHFRMVIAELKKRNLRLGFQRKDEYVVQLNKFARKGGSREARLIEKLLVCALIEARSCERFRMLSLGLDDPDLQEFYHKFMVSEAGHYRMFLNLAEEYGNKSDVRQRWQEYLDHEAEIIKNLSIRGDRIH